MRRSGEKRRREWLGRGEEAEGRGVGEEIDALVSSRTTMDMNSRLHLDEPDIQGNRNVRNP